MPHPLYQIWATMKQRCHNPNSQRFKYYGKRGIKVCAEWMHNFGQFAKDMYPTYKKGLSLDRIDNNGNYEKENCKWSTQLEQNRNRRNVMFPNLDKNELLDKREVALTFPKGSEIECIICSKPTIKRNKRNVFCCQKHFNIYHQKMKSS